jgi:hypothetical protein
MHYASSAVQSYMGEQLATMATAAVNIDAMQCTHIYFIAFT